MAHLSRSSWAFDDHLPATKGIEGAEGLGRRRRWVVGAAGAAAQVAFERHAYPPRGSVPGWGWAAAIRSPPERPATGLGAPRGNIAASTRGAWLMTLGGRGARAHLECGTPTGRGWTPSRATAAPGHAAHPQGRGRHHDDDAHRSRLRRGRASGPPPRAPRPAHRRGARRPPQERPSAARGSSSDLRPIWPSSPSPAGAAGPF
jgi:hypothetical protein